MQVNKTTKTLLNEWKEVLDAEDLSESLSSYKKRTTARLLENTKERLLSETTNQTNGIDNVDPVLIQLVRRTAPNLMAYDIAGVQPMTGPTGLIFAMRAFYGNQPDGPFGRPGDGRSGFLTGSDLDSNNLTKQEANAEAGVASNEAFYNEADTTHSGTGTQTSNATAPTYSAYSVATGMATGTAEVLSGGSWGQMSFTIEKKSVEAKERALKGQYTVELAQDLRNVHGLDAESELSNIISTELTAEINREMINQIRQSGKVAEAEKTYTNGTLVTDTAGAPVLGTAGEFDLEVNSDGRWSAEKYKSLLFKINKEANAIAKDTRRGRGNIIICSSDVASVLDLTGKLDYAPGIDNNLQVDDTGNTYVGMLQGRFKVYIDPYLGYDEVIVGYKGATQYDAGLFYCPYIPLQMYKATDPDTMQPVMAFKTRYGMTANPFTTLSVNKNSYYRKFIVKNL